MKVYTYAFLIILTFLVAVIVSNYIIYENMKERAKKENRIILSPDHLTGR